MFTSRTLTAILTLTLAAGPVLSLDRNAPGRAPASQAQIENQVPANTAGAFFLNVRRLFKLYGDLIEQHPSYSQIGQAIAAGFPDPAKDLDQIGIVVPLKNGDFTPIFAGTITGALDMEKLLAFAKNMGLPLTPSMYQGVTLMTTTLDQQSAQIGFVNEETTLFSLDKTGTHDLTRAIVATLKGEQPGYGAAHGLELPAEQIASLHLEVPAEISAYFVTGSPDLKPLQHVRFASAILAAADATLDGSLAVKLTCETDAQAAEVEAALKKLIGWAEGLRRGHAATDLVKRLKFTLSGKELTIRLELTRKEIEELVGR